MNTRLEFFFQLEDYGGAIKHVEAIANSQNLPCPHLGYITKLEEALRQKGLTAELETLKVPTMHSGCGIQARLFHPSLVQ